MKEVMKELKITYTHSTPQSMGNAFLFWNCENIPYKLPEYIKELNIDPMKFIGYGLSIEEAVEINNYLSVTNTATQTISQKPTEQHQESTQQDASE